MLRHLTRLCRFLIAIIVLTSMSLPVLAVNGQSVVKGRVLDPDGAAIPGAAISVESKGRLVLTTTANDRGEFS